MPNVSRGSMRSSPTPDSARREQIEALHEEVDRLTEKYRAPLVLCFAGQGFATGGGDGCDPAPPAGGKP
jgi:hypothetical protein